MERPLSFGLDLVAALSHPRRFALGDELMRRGFRRVDAALHTMRFNATRRVHRVSVHSRAFKGKSEFSARCIAYETQIHNSTHPKSWNLDF